MRLALLRILVGVVIFGAADVWRAPLLAVDHPSAAYLLRPVVLASSALVVAGLWTRAACVVLGASVTVLLGMIQEQGTPIHVHHLAWISILLATAPAGRAWSVDAWRASRRSSPEVPSSGQRTSDDAVAESALRWTCVLLALVYFFPGLHKLVDDGSPFADTASLVRLVRLKSLEAGSDVALGLDSHPTALLLGGVIVICAELVVVVAALKRPTVGFIIVAFVHVVIAVVMRFSFSVLAIFSLAFLLPTTRGLLPLVGGRETRRPVLPTVAGLVLVVGTSVAGVRGDIAGYPFACYPTFSVPVPDRIRVLAMSIDSGDGIFVDIPHGVLIPDDVRTPVTFASRRVSSAEDARRFLRWRRADSRFEEAISGAQVARIVVIERDLNHAKADVAVMSFEVPLDAARD